jgi:hypothetical protein
VQVAADPNAALPLARATVLGKLHNQTTVLRRYAGEQDQRARHAAQTIGEQMPRARSAAALDSLRGYEGAAAAAYFSGWASLFDAQRWDFGGRAYHPPPDPVNAMLSLGYTLLLHDIVGAAQRIGLDRGLQAIAMQPLSPPASCGACGLRHSLPGWIVLRSHDLWLRPFAFRRLRVVWRLFPGLGRHIPGQQDGVRLDELLNAGQLGGRQRGGNVCLQCGQVQRGQSGDLAAQVMVGTQDHQQWRERQSGAQRRRDRGRVSFAVRRQDGDVAQPPQVAQELLGLSPADPRFLPGGKRPGAPAKGGALAQGP